MKCKVCRKHFTPDSRLVYQVSDSISVVQALTVSQKTYDAIDCPRCGCQLVLNVRMPKAVKGGAEDDD